MADLEKLRQNLEQRGFTVSLYATKQEAAAALGTQIQGKKIGVGGSMTIEELGLYDVLREHNQVFWHWKTPGADTLAQAQKAPVYLTSANAVAETGEIINIDGTGNRVAATLYDKEAVYIIVGVNKLAPDFEAALHRARNVAAPLNARRLGRKTPCAQGELRCHDCQSPERICKGLTVLWRKMGGVDRCEVVIVNEPLGY